jgi:hypothetical protein
MPAESTASRLYKLESSLNAIHKRVDDQEKNIKEALVEIAKDVKELNGWMNRGKGWAAAAMVLSGTVGALLTKFIK